MTITLDKDYGHDIRIKKLENNLKHLKNRIVKFEKNITTLVKILGENKKEENEIIKELKSLQRVYQISSSDDVLSKLLNDGFDSALDIIQDGKDRIKNYKKRIDGLEKTKLKK